MKKHHMRNCLFQGACFLFFFWYFGADLRHGQTIWLDVLGMAWTGTWFILSAINLNGIPEEAWQRVLQDIHWTIITVSREGEKPVSAIIRYDNNGPIDYTPEAPLWEFGIDTRTREKLDEFRRYYHIKGDGRPTDKRQALIDPTASQ